MLDSTSVVNARLYVTSLWETGCCKLHDIVGLLQEAEQVRMTTGKSVEEASKLRDDADALAGRVAVTSREVANQEAVESSQRTLIDDVSSEY